MHFTCPLMRASCACAHLCCASMFTAILAALAVVLSTSCASSRQIRNQRSLVNGVGSTCQSTCAHNHHPFGWMLGHPQEAAAFLQCPTACNVMQTSISNAIQLIERSFFLSLASYFFA